MQVNISPGYRREGQYPCYCLMGTVVLGTEYHSIVNDSDFTVSESTTCSRQGEMEEVEHLIFL